MKDQDKSKKGIEISNLCEWDGADIMDIFQIALEDSNFHTFNEELTELRKKHNI